MKICPECSTQYERHLEQCLVDGATLEAPNSLETEEPSPEPAPQRGKAAGLIGLLFFGLGALFIVGLLVVFFLMTPGSGSETPPITTPAPAPVAAPLPPPAPEKPTVIKVGITSDPAGARVFENDVELCTTPCTIEHPDIASLPRTFLLKADGRRSTSIEMTDPNVPQFVKLPPKPSSARPRPRPTPRPTPPVPSPRPSSAPSIGMER